MPRGQCPNWEQVESVYRRYVEKGAPVHGGLFFSGSVLTQYRWEDEDEWVEITDAMDTPSKNVLAYKIIWHSLPQAELNAYETAPFATSFKLAYDKFYENLNNSSTLGDDHPDALVSMNNLVTLLHDQGKLAEAVFNAVPGCRL